MLAILLIAPEPGEFRTKLTSLASEIKAYKLLERNKSQTLEEYSTESSSLIIKPHKIEFKEAGDENNNHRIKHLEKNLIKAIKSESAENKKLYFNNGVIESIKNS